MHMCDVDLAQELLEEVGAQRAVALLACQLVATNNHQDMAFGHGLKQWLRDNGYEKVLQDEGRYY